MENREDFGQEHIPRQQIGAQMDTVETRSFEQEEMAVDFFRLARHRLLDISRWSLLAGESLSGFQLVNAFGNVVERLAEEGDHVRIDIPGPGPSAGGGYDWVILESIVETSEPGMEMVTLRARPVSNPLSNQGDTAHFLTEQASSTFQVKRIGRHIYAEEHGRNEQANTYTKDTADNVRNMLVGWAATLGFSYPQWKALVKGLLSDPQ